MEKPGSRTLWVTFCGLAQLFLCSPARGEGGAAAQSVATPAAVDGVRRVVLVQGIYDRYVGNMQEMLSRKGWELFTVRLKPNDGSVGFEVMAGQLEAFVNANVPAGEKFDLVGFSMGGLVCRYYIQKMGGYLRVRRFVTLSTPNHGTLWACLSGRAGVKQMRPGSEMLRELNGDVSKLGALDYTSIYTPLDLTIVPATSSRLEGAHNVVVWVPLHPLMVWMRGPLRAVEGALE